MFRFDRIEWKKVICLENNNWIFSDEYKEMIENIGQITKDLSPKFFTVCQNNLVKIQY